MASATATPVASRVRSSQSASSRNQEKDDLRHLNDRLATYIQWVQELESERSSMLLQLEEKHQSKSRVMSKMKRLYEEELTDVRCLLDEVAGEKAQLQIDCGNLRDELKKLQVRWRVSNNCTFLSCIYQEKTSFSEM